MENIILVFLIVLTLVSISMGKSVRNNSVNIYLKFVCVVLCLYNFFILIAAYYMLFTKGGTTRNLSFMVTGTYLVSYWIPPMMYDNSKFCHKLIDQLFGFFSYLVCIPMYQIVFQIFAYANIHDVTWGNRDASTST